MCSSDLRLAPPATRITAVTLLIGLLLFQRRFVQSLSSADVTRRAWERQSEDDVPTARRIGSGSRRAASIASVSEGGFSTVSA